MHTPENHKIKAVAFDFDGTLADSFAVFVHAIEYALKRQSLTPEEVEELRQHSMREIIRLLKVKKWQLPLVVTRGMKEIDRHQSDIRIFPGVAGVLRELSAAGYKLYIVSSHSEQGIRLFLEEYQLTNCIEHIYAKVGLFGKPKSLKKLQQHYQLQPYECLFVGDEIRDIEAAQKVGMPSVAVTWGFNTEQALKAQGPDIIIKEPREIMTSIRAL